MAQDVASKVVIEEREDEPPDSEKDPLIERDLKRQEKLERRSRPTRAAGARHEAGVQDPTRMYETRSQKKVNGFSSRPVDPPPAGSTH